MRLMRDAPAALLLLLASTSALAQDNAATTVARIAEDSRFQAAQRALDEDHDRFVEEIVALTEIPAPPFKEAERAEALAERFRTVGLHDVTIDAEGNVTALRPGTNADAKLVVVSAHIDTVFPEGTPVQVRREGTRLYAPGVGDDTRGLATLLAYARALDASGIATRQPILFVGTVGEEGRGDLRGVRHLFTEGEYKNRIGAFFSIDGNNAARVTHGGVGSKRYRVVFSGPGGHSWGAFGTVNPIAALADAVARLYEIKVPSEPKTTYSASVVGGGTSVNSIPDEVYLDVDMRSQDRAALADLERRFLTIVEQAAARENEARSTKDGRITVEPQPIGDRPAGSTAADAPIVGYAEAAVRTMGLEPELGASSTDSNLPMSLGVPSVTIGFGGDGGRSHSVDEWIDVAKPESVRGMTVGLLALLATAGMQVE